MLPADATQGAKYVLPGRVIWSLFFGGEVKESLGQKVAEPKSLPVLWESLACVIWIVFPRLGDCCGSFGHVISTCLP